MYIVCTVCTLHSEKKDTLISSATATTLAQHSVNSVLRERGSSDVGYRRYRLCEVGGGLVHLIRVRSVGCSDHPDYSQESDTAPRSSPLPRDVGQLDECHGPKALGEGTGLLHRGSRGDRASADTSRGPNTVPLVGTELHHTQSHTHQQTLKSCHY